MTTHPNGPDSPRQILKGKGMIRRTFLSAIRLRSSLDPATLRPREKMRFGSSCTAAALRGQWYGYCAASRAEGTLPNLLQRRVRGTHESFRGHVLPPTGLRRRSTPLHRDAEYVQRRLAEPAMSHHNNQSECPY